MLATAFAWVLIWHLERRAIGSVQVLGVDTPQMQASSDAYRKLLLEAGCEIVSETRNPKKSLIELVFTSPRAVDEGVLRTAGERLPEETRGVAAWEVS